MMARACTCVFMAGEGLGVKRLVAFTGHELISIEQRIGINSREEQRKKTRVEKRLIMIIAPGKCDSLGRWLRQRSPYRRMEGLSRSTVYRLQNVCYGH